MLGDIVMDLVLNLKVTRIQHAQGKGILGLDTILLISYTSQHI
jgi:hypothetical protein